MAIYLGVSLRTVTTLVSEGKLVPICVRGVNRFTYEAVDAYLRTVTGKRR